MGTTNDEIFYQTYETPLRALVIKGARADVRQPMVGFDARHRRSKRAILTRRRVMNLCVATSLVVIFMVLRRAAPSAESYTADSDSFSNEFMPPKPQSIHEYPDDLLSAVRALLHRVVPAVQDQIELELLPALEEGQ
eukprot:6491663-Pyramimonas_sp.AAC.1